MASNEVTLPEGVKFRGWTPATIANERAEIKVAEERIQFVTGSRVNFSHARPFYFFFFFFFVAAQVT